MIDFKSVKSKPFIVICTIIFLARDIADAQSPDNAIAFSKSFDLTAQPCDNFFKHVCGNFQKDVEFPKSKSQFDKYSMLSDVIIKQIAEVLEKEIGPREPKIFNHIKTYYRSCLNTTSIESRGLVPLQNILDKLGGWPVAMGDAWKGDNFNWIETDEAIRSLGYTTRYIFRPYVMRDLEDPSRNALYIRSVDTKLKDLSHADYVMKAYLDYMINVAVLLGADKARAAKELNEAVSFELNLTTPQDLVDYMPLEMDEDRLTIDELQRLHPYVSWLEYLNNLTYPNFIVERTDKVSLESAVYLLGVGNLIANTSRRTLANYMLWRVIDDSVDFLNDEIRGKKLLFEKTCSGVSESESRQTDCLNKMIDRDSSLLQGISAMYVKNLFKHDTQSKVGQIISDIHERYRDHLQKNEWLDESTKKRVLKKHERMKRIIGYPEKLVDTGSLDSYYDNLYFEANNYLKNALTLNNFTYGKNIKELTQSPDENCWIELGVAANVLIHYHKMYNAMVLPASVLQYPFFDETQPNYINYGNMGSFVGHEITHAYTLPDEPLDENGAHTQWWTDDAQINFYEKASCYMDHYNNFTSDADRNLTNKLSLNENLADNEGFKIAFEAYKIWKSNHGEEPLLPNLNYTNEQLFWVTAASTLCTRRREENRKLQLFTDEHASEELRINGAMSNIPDFARAFNCPAGSPMNPEQKCTFF